MRKRLHLPALSLLLATSSAVLPAAQAGEMNSSEASVVITSLIVVSLPLAASAKLVELSAEPFKGSSRRNAATRSKATPLPPMEVKAVDTSSDGQRQVHLQVPDHSDQTATLKWPAVKDQDPTSAFTVGQTVHFTPTPTGAGWMVRNPAQQPLAYVPTAYAAADNLSEHW